MAERVPTSLLGALADLVKWLESAQISAMVIGGVASSFLGRPRMTQDVDALAILPENIMGRCHRSGAEIDFVHLVECGKLRRNCGISSVPANGSMTTTPRTRPALRRSALPRPQNVHSEPPERDDQHDDLCNDSFGGWDET